MRHRVRSLLLVGLLPLVLVVTACSASADAGSSVASLDGVGASASGDPGETPAVSLSPEDAALEFARCMRENGVDMPDPQVGSGGQIQVRIGGADGELDLETLQEAQEACGGLMRGGFEPGATIPPEMLDQLVAFAECMREQGIDMPDPGTGGGGMIAIGGDGLDPSSEEFQAATEACAEFAPGLPGAPAGDADGG